MTGINTGIKRRTAFLLLAAALAAFAAIAVFAFADDSSAESGDCGTNVHWSYDAGTLTITGTGAMTDWGSASAVPWNAHRAEINNISVADGVTTIGGYAFKECQMTEFVIPDSVTTLGKSCFAGCDKMTSLTIGSKVNNFSAEMMIGCTAMNTVILTGDNYVLSEYNSMMLFTKDKKELLYLPAAKALMIIWGFDETERIGAHALRDTNIPEINWDKFPSLKYYGDESFANSHFQEVFRFGPETEYVGSNLWGDVPPHGFVFHLDFKGTLKNDFITAKFVNDDDTECKDLPKDLLGKQFGLDDDDPLTYRAYYAALSIRYLFTDGSTAAPRVYDMQGAGVQYSIGSPDVSGYTPDIPSVDGTSDGNVRDVIVTYSNQQFHVVYYYNGDEVMNDMEYYGHTVDVKTYDKGKIHVTKWYSMNVQIVDGKFVMPEMDVFLYNTPIGIEREDSQDAPESMATGLAIAVMAMAAALILLNFRRH